MKIKLRQLYYSSFAISILANTTLSYATHTSDFEQSPSHPSVSTQNIGSSELLGAPAVMQAFENPGTMRKQDACNQIDLCLNFLQDSINEVETVAPQLSEPISKAINNFNKIISAARLSRQNGSLQNEISELNGLLQSLDKQVIASLDKSMAEKFIKAYTASFKALLVEWEG